MRPRLALATPLLLAALLLASRPAHAAPGDVDLAFGVDGIATISTGGATQSEPSAIARAADGALLIAGHVRQARSEYAAALVRLLPDGTRDVDFGDGGEVLFPEFVDAVGVAEQSGGRVVIALVGDSAGGARRATVLVRLDQTGTPDPSFGDEGRVDVGPFLPSSDIVGLAADGDDRLVLLVRAWEGAYRSVLIRFDEGGDVDPSFATDGIRWLEIEGRALSVSPEGLSLVAFLTQNATALRRFDATGALDATFGDGGTLILDSGPLYLTVAAWPRTDGRLLVVGGTAAMLFEPSGARVTSFGDGGTLQLASWFHDPVPAAVAGPDDGFVVGWQEPPTDPNAYAMRITAYDASGATVPSFGDDGIVHVSAGATHDDVADMVVTPDGRIVLAVRAFNGRRWLDIGAVAFTAAGVPDPGFGEDGVASLVDATLNPDAMLDGRFTNDAPRKLARHADGRLVVVAESSDNRIVMVRYLADGTLDGGVAYGGLLARYYGHDAFPTAAIGDPIGRLLMAGGSASSPDDEWIARLDGALAPDPSFAGTGSLRRRDAWRALALQSDGRILAGGVGVVRLEDDGARDWSFGEDGVAQAVPGVYAEEHVWRRLLVQPDDSFLAVGEYVGELIIARYDASGVLDEGYGSGGVVRLVGSPVDAALQADGKLLVLANVAPFSATPRDLRVLRFSANGSLDASFGDGGTAKLPAPDAVYPEIESGQSPLRTRVAALAVDRAGGILVAGSVFDGRHRRAAVVRLHGDAPSTCGNGTVEPTEDCDDGNSVAGDGCDAACAVEPCFVCRGTPSTCTADAPDADGDGVCDSIDVCAATPDPEQQDGDGDGIGDACDRCPLVVDPAQSNADRDRRGDVCDVCPFDWPFFRDVDLRLTTNGAGGGRFLAVARFPYDLPFLDPVDDGFRLVVHDASGAVVLDVDAPPGAYDSTTRTGWRRGRGSLSSWRFRSRLTREDAFSVDVKPLGDDLTAVVVRGRRASLELPTSLPLTVTPVGRDPDRDSYPRPGECQGLQLDASPPAPASDGCVLQNGGRALLCRSTR